MRKTLLLLTVLVCIAAGPVMSQELQGTVLGPGAIPASGSPRAVGDFLTQPPNQSLCFVSDPGLSQILAEDFVVSGSPVQVDELVLWGFYWTNNILGTDNFHVRFMLDASGLPGGDVAPQEINVPTAKFDTGVDFASMDEYQFTLSLVSPVSLDPGTYWVEIYNEITDTSDFFCWEGGNLDATNGIAGAAQAREAPGVNWIAIPSNMSIELNGVIVPVELESFEIEK